jgi:hypothetical protein
MEPDKTLGALARDLSGDSNHRSIMPQMITPLKAAYVVAESAAYRRAAKHVPLNIVAKQD